MRFHERHAARRAKSLREDRKHKGDQSFGTSGLKSLGTTDVMDMARSMPAAGADKLTDPSKPLVQQRAKRQGFRTPGA